MVDFKKMLDDFRKKGKFVGYCSRCDTDGKIHEIDILPAYKDLPEKKRKYKCPNCKTFNNWYDLIPF